MKSSFRLFRIFGIEIGIHYTWIFIFIFFSWSLAQGYFPDVNPDWSTAAYWITGIIAALLLFASVLMHELAHSLVARRRGMPVNSIVLFILGGVSNLEKEPEKASAEFAMAIVGPGTSFVLALVFFGLSYIPADGTGPVAAVLSYLALINALLGAFNLLPGFPLDGGRVLRSILWGSTGNLVKATNIAGIVGQTIGWMMIAAGVYLLFTVSFISGLWLAFIGWFLNSAADASRKEISLRERLSVIKVSDIVNPAPEVVTPQTTISELVRDIFGKKHGRAVPVCKDDKLVGIVTITDIREVNQSEWDTTPVEKIMTRDPLYTVLPTDNVNTAFKMLAKQNINQVLVERDGKCAGLLSRADIISHLQFTQELGMGSR
jgi:Zn-dependent protease/CBS domain-containing protein